MEVRGRPVLPGVHLQAENTTGAEYAREPFTPLRNLGMTRCWTFDHILRFCGANDRPGFETLTRLGAMALRTARTPVGVLVNGDAYRGPAIVAKAAAHVDRMTARRLERRG